jgi:hypothetical protein
MTNRFTTLAAAVAIFVGFSAPAAADDYVPLQSIGHWKIRANATVCDARGTFEDGTRLDFSINAHAAVVFTVVNPSWRIPEGKYDVVTQVDRSAQRTSEADAFGDHVMWWTPVTEETINLLSYGRTLSVKVGQTVLSYDLALSEAVFKALVRCAAPRIAAANPFANTAPQASAPPANPFAETASNPYRRM